MNSAISNHIVVIGAGFGGMAVTEALANTSARVTLVDKHNYHLFQPLLYQVATAALSPADIAEPVRRMLRHSQNTEVMLGDVTGISTGERFVSLADGRSLSYDILVIACGATHSYFGHDDWEKYAPGLKTIADARQIRSRLLSCFEQAEMCDDPAERERLMTFVVVGGGPSGVELAGSISELARYSLAKDFRRIDPKSAHVILAEAGSTILSVFPKALQRYASHKLSALGVEVWTGCAIKNITNQSVTVGADTIPVGLAIWAAGVAPTNVAKMLGVPLDKSGRIKVERDLSVPALTNVYALGDIALCHDAGGKPLPGLAQVAKQQGTYLGNALAQSLHTGAPAKAFVFHDRGNVAIIGRHAAVADFGWLRVKGPLAWLLWATVHIWLLAGLQHRLLVAVQWLWRYLTYDRGARLIVEPLSASAEDRSKC